MWWKTAKPGDKVVCIGRWGEATGPNTHLWAKVGSVYEVKQIFEDDYFPCGFGVHLGYYNSIGGEVVENCERFRPIDPASKKADRVLASLKPSLLNPIPIRKHETAGGE